MLSIEKAEKMFVEISCSQENKHGHIVCGDAFLSRMIDGENRYVAVLSDGLGSGVKANVLSTMTASMALNFRLRHEPIERTAITIMNTLPTDSVRNISYSTFSIVDIENEGDTAVMEYDNPDFVFIRNNKNCEITKEVIEIKSPDKPKKIRLSKLKMFKGDRLIIYSDGVNQSGIGLNQYPFGWEREGLIEFIEETIAENPEISARDLSKTIIRRAYLNDQYKAKDDTSCAVIYMREPRKLLICSGPPYNEQKDKYLADVVASYPGKKIICGGTTSMIISRELNREISMDIDVPMVDLPPVSEMEGVDLITEGILTLGAVAQSLDKSIIINNKSKSPEDLIIKMIQESDVIDIMVGTRINVAHQDPNLPVELEIRRNVIKKIADILEEKYLKKVELKFI